MGVIMQIKNCIIMLCTISTAIFTNTDCYTMEELPNSSVQYPNLNSIMMNSESAPIIENNNQIREENIDYYKQEYIALKSKIEELSKDLEQLKNSHKILNTPNNKSVKLTNEQCRDKLKLIYNMSNKPNISVSTSTYWQSNNAWSNFYNNEINLIGSMKNSNIFKDIYKYSHENLKTYKNCNNCNSITTIQNNFEKRVQYKIEELEKCKKYLNSILDYLPEDNKDNSKIRNEIILFIDNYLDPINNKILNFKSIQQNLKIEENLPKIDECIGTIQCELNEMINKIKSASCDMEERCQDIYEDMNIVSKKYNDILNHEFFKKL